MHLYWILTKLRSSSGSSGRFAHTIFAFLFVSIVPSFGRRGVHTASSLLNYQWKCNSRRWYENVLRDTAFTTRNNAYSRMQKNVYVFFALTERSRFHEWIDVRWWWWSFGNVIIFVLPELIFFLFFDRNLLFLRWTLTALATHNVNDSEAKTRCKQITMNWLQRIGRTCLRCATLLYCVQTNNELKSPFARVRSVLRQPSTECPFIIIILWN